MGKTNKLLLLNGPNLNLLGKRQPEIYGNTSLNEIEIKCVKLAKDQGFDMVCFQSNHEGAIIDRIQECWNRIDGIVFNPAAFTHTSIVLRDTLLATQIPFVEIHISDIKEREAFRHNSYFEDIAIKSIIGKGIAGYEIATDLLISHLNSQEI